MEKQQYSELSRNNNKLDMLLLPNKGVPVPNNKLPLNDSLACLIAAQKTRLFSKCPTQEW